MARSPQLESRPAQRGTTRYPLETLRRDGQTLRVSGVKHMVGTVVSSGIAVGEDMYLHLEPLDSAATLTVRRTTPVVQVEVLPPMASDG